jgi:hypothetical protein
LSSRVGVSCLQKANQSIHHIKSTSFFKLQTPIHDWGLLSYHSWAELLSSILFQILAELDEYANCIPLPAHSHNHNIQHVNIHFKVSIAFNTS